MQAFQYLLKNDLEKTFKQCMDDVMTMMPSIMEAYFIPSDAGGVKVPLRNILYFEVQNHTIYAHILDYSRDHLCYAGKISSIESDLNNKGFLRIHKSYLVNMKHIERITKTHVHLTNSIELPCSRKNYSEILTKYMLWEAQE